MRDLRVATDLGALTGEAAGRWLRAAWKRWLEDGLSAVAADLVKDGLWAAPTGAFVAELMAGVTSALQGSATLPGADVLCLKIGVQNRRSRAEGSRLALVCLAFSGSTLSRTTALAAFVAAAVQRCATHSHALRRLGGSLVAETRRCRAAAVTDNGDGLQTRPTFTRVTLLLAGVSAREELVAEFLAVWNGILAGSSRLFAQFAQ